MHMLGSSLKMRSCLILVLVLVVGRKEGSEEDELLNNNIYLIVYGDIMKLDS